MSNELGALFGRRFGKTDLVAIFSARLDESGTDGLSLYTVVAGAVATPLYWNELERRWAELLRQSKIDSYHYAEFQNRDDPFKGWSDFKRRRFKAKQEKIINDYTNFRISAAVERATHKQIKQKMKGIRGFTADSDYSLCLRVIMFWTSHYLEMIDPDHKLTIMVEDGPWSAGANFIYQRVANMTGKWKPAKYAHRLAGFASVPAWQRPSLEAADY